MVPALTALVLTEGVGEGLRGGVGADSDHAIAAGAEELKGEEVGLLLQLLDEGVHLQQVEHGLAVDAYHLRVMRSSRFVS